MIQIKKENILIKPEDINPSSKKFKVIGTLNPGAVRLPDKKIALYVRVIEKLIKHENKKYCFSPRFVGAKNFKIKIDKFDKKLIQAKSELDFIFKNGTKRLSFISHLRRVLLDESGFKIISIDKKPSFYGICKDGEFGVEDPRITKIENKYIMTYVSLSQEQNISTSCAFSKDCIKWKRQGIIFGQQDKDVVIFPEKINEKYVAFDRPEGSFQFTLPHIWIAYSKDLKSWGNLKAIDCVYEEKGSCSKNGAGPPPIKTKKGWLLIFHAVVEKDSEKCKGENYLAGAALFDLKNPSKLIAKSKTPIFIPDKKRKNLNFEDKKVVFPTGMVLDENGKDVLIYCGEEDVLTSVKKLSLDSIIKSLKKC